MASLTYSGQRVVDVNGIQSDISKLVNTNRKDDSISVGDIRLDFQDEGEVRLSIEMTGRGTIDELVSLRDAMADEIVKLDFEADAETARSKIRA